MKKMKRLLSVICCLCLAAGTVGMTAFAATQIINSGGDRSDTNIKVSKTISETGTENLFDITLKVQSARKASGYYEQPPMAIAIVLDMSNTMFTEDLFEPSLEVMESFVEQYCDSSAGALVPRELSIIMFNTNAKVLYSLNDCKNESPAYIMSKVNEGVKPYFDDIDAYNDSPERFTNTEAGLKLADNVLSNAKAENKYILFFTDGLPTTYIDRSSGNMNDTSSIKGFTPITSNGTIGTDGVFYNAPTSQYCDKGTNYSDKAALLAQNQADAIKDKNIKIYSVGMNIDSQKQVEDMIANTVDYDGINDYVVNSSQSQLFGNDVMNYKYKNWLYSNIGSEYYFDGSNLEQIEKAYNDIFSLIEVDSKSKNVDKWKVLDSMNSDSANQNIEFISFFDAEGNLVNSNSLSGTSEENKENTSSFDAVDEKINWDLLTSGYSIQQVSGTKRYVYELKYRVRLKNERKGFVGNTSLLTNGETSLKYIAIESGKIVEKTICFPIPEVKGYLGNLTFTIVDGYGDDLGGTALPGAQFQLIHSTSCEQCQQIGHLITIEPQTDTSDADGNVAFLNIPSGHCYKLYENVAPNGYNLPANPYSVEVREGAVYVDGVAAPSTLSNQPDTFTLSYVITTTDNPSAEMTDATPATKTDVLYNRNVTIESGLTTTETVNAAGIPGTWKFGGWYADASCTGEPIASINIKKNETVYGKWEFEPIEETTTEETTIPTTSVQETTPSTGDSGNAIIYVILTLLIGIGVMIGVKAKKNNA